MGTYSFAAASGLKILGLNAGDQSVQQMSESQLGAIKQEIQGLGLNIQNLDVQFAGPGTLTLTGSASSKADAEKASLAAGNVMGISSVNNNITVSSPTNEPDSDMYPVDKGDSLWKIAEMYYGDGSKYPQIVAANQPMIKDADKIYPGQVLRIPKLS